MNETRRYDAPPPEPDREPAVDGEAVELPPPAPQPGAAEPPPVLPEPAPATAPIAMPDAAPAPAPAMPAFASAAPPPPPAPVQAQTTVTASPPPAAPLPPVLPPATGMPVGDGHAPASDPSVDRIKALATERPELVVGAAFAGGILAAMILRSLGN
jgi:hypothetical protein